MKSLSIILNICALFLLRWINLVEADCVSYGVDFIDGGTYFINTASPDYFNFTSYFEGCEPDVATNVVVPADTGDMDYCSDTPTTPDDTDQTAVCNNPSFPLLKSDMTSGQYILMILGNNGNGNPFAYQRIVNIIAGTQTTLTATPTVIIPYTITPTVTSTSTEVDTDTVTGLTPTVTEPSKTIDRTKTTTPSPVRVTTTKTLTRTRTSKTYTLIPTTKTVPPPCFKWLPKKDRPLTALPPGVYAPGLQKIISEAVAASKTNTSVSRRQSEKFAYRNFVRREQDLEKRGLARRSPDQSITVVVETTSIVSVTSTITGTPYIVTDYATTTTITTVTPPPVTVVKGKTVVFHTVTAPTPTKTRTTRVQTTTFTTTTVSVTWTKTVTTGKPTPCWGHGY